MHSINTPFFAFMASSKQQSLEHLSFADHAAHLSALKRKACVNSSASPSKRRKRASSASSPVILTSTSTGTSSFDGSTH